MASENPKTLADTLRQSCKKYANRVAYMVPNKVGYTKITYKEFAALVRCYCAALIDLGLTKGDRVAIQSENCHEWALLDWACQSLGIALVPIYPSLPKDQAQFIAKNAEVKLCVAGSKEHAERLKGIKGVPVMMLRGEAVSIAELATKRTLSEEDWNAAIDNVMPGDLATLIYTSGTTGNPKGVILSHRAPCFLNHAVMSSLPIDHNDVFFSFLPLSHVFERYAGHWLPISCGACIGYMKSLSGILHDLETVKPTIFLTVPRFLEAMQDRITDSMAKQSGFKQKMFKMTLAQGKKKTRGGMAPLMPFLDLLVGTKIREKLGGKIRFFVAGGAALAPHTYEFWASFGLPVHQAYGLTETCAAVSIVPFGEENKYWTVGRPVAGVEAKFAEDGELLVRGENIMDGYHKLPEDTAAAMTSDGWLHTGDIGQWEGDLIKITDRKKDLLVLANGKNVAPQPIETKLKESRFVSEVVLFGDACEYVYGLVIPHFEHLSAYLSGQGLKPPSNAEMLHLEPVKALLKEEIGKVNKSLADFERMKRYELIDATFSIESGELTPSMKVKRKVVREKFKDVLDRLAGK